MAGRSQFIAIPHKSRRTRSPARITARVARRLVVAGGSGRSRARSPVVVYESATKLGKPSLLVNNASIFEEDHVGTLEPRPLQPADDHQLHRAGLPDPGLRRDARPRATRATSSTSSTSGPGGRRRLFLLPDVEVGALGRDPHAGAGARAAHPGQRHRARARRSRTCGRTPSDSGRRPRPFRFGRGPDLAEFGRTIRYLVENRSITGQMIGLDGGQHLVWETPDMAEFDT